MIFCPSLDTVGGNKKEGSEYLIVDLLLKRRCVPTGFKTLCASVPIFFFFLIQSSDAPLSPFSNELPIEKGVYIYYICTRELFVLFYFVVTSTVTL